MARRKNPMKGWKATQPKARVPFCWECSRKLYAGGRSYVTVTLTNPFTSGKQKVYMHATCAKIHGYEVENR